MDPCWNLPKFHAQLCATYSQKTCIYLVRGFNPFEKYLSKSNLPQIGVKMKISETPPRYIINIHPYGRLLFSFL